MKKYDFSAIFELNEKDTEIIRNLPMYPYFTHSDQNLKIYRVCYIRKTGKSIDSNKYKVISSYIKVAKNTLILIRKK